MCLILTVLRKSHIFHPADSPNATRLGLFSSLWGFLWLFNMFGWLRMAVDVSWNLVTLKPLNLAFVFSSQTGDPTVRHYGRTHSVFHPQPRSPSRQGLRKNAEGCAEDRASGKLRISSVKPIKTMFFVCLFVCLFVCFLSKQVVLCDRENEYDFIRTESRKWLFFFFFFFFIFLIPHRSH